MRFLIAAYCGPRAVIVNGVATDTVHAIMASVVAGCAHATALMKLTLVDSLDYVVARWPSVKAAVAVDDTLFQMIGRPGAVRLCIMEATREFEEPVESAAGMIVSAGKFERSGGGKPCATLCANTLATSASTMRAAES